MTLREKVYESMKRGLDLGCSGIGLLVLSPVLGVVGLAVRANLGSPVIYKQQRPGKNGRLFTLYKFRTMKIVNELDDVENDHLRLTPFGQRLRALSLDELPSLFNVLKGDMSIVGPRPLLAEYIPLYSATQARRHEVRPGITGLAQVMGRNDLSWEDKFRYDLEYVERRSLRMDVMIILRTLSAVTSKRGVAKEGLVTTDRFMGSADDR